MKKKYKVFSKNKYKSNNFKKRETEILTETHNNNLASKKTTTKKVNKKFSKKYSAMMLSLLMVVVFTVVLSTSYAYFTSTIKAKEFVIYTGNLAVNYAKKTNVINVENLYPMTDEQGLALTPHEFTVTNSGNISARYQIRLELDNTSKDMIPIEYIKLSYQENNGEYSKPVLLSELNSSLVFISNVIIDPTEPNNSNTYGIKLWIDLSAPNDIQGKTFKVKVVVDSIQNVEDGYVVDTAPIITLNKTSTGTTDINLKVNETYTELGVEKVEDDQELFIPSQVTKTYEYYDGTNLTTVSSIDTSKAGIYYITYSITDKSNNTGKAIRIVTVNNTDTIPTITLNGDATITLGENDDYVESGVTVASNNRVITIGEVKTSTPGTYTIRYIVIDENNNLNSVIRTVNVVKPYTEELLNGTDPVLTSNLVPVTISDIGVVTKASTASTWYDYETKQWANAVVLKDDNAVYANGQTISEEAIESYFVWIPRYKYKLFNLGNYTTVTSIDSTKPHAISIKFGTTDTSDAVTGECTTPGIAGESGNCEVGEYMTHPAFLAFDSNGFWVGKFETGYDGATSTTAAQVNSSNSSKVIIKPNIYSWRNLTVENMFKASYDYLRTDESHMIKNTEWGAVAYLHHSEYGSKSSLRINNNSSYITGYAATEEPTKGYNSGTSIAGNRVESTSLGANGTYTVNYLNANSVVASTTGNNTGIYDMSGGAWEYVAGYTTGATTVGGASGITSIYSDFFTNSSWNKYYDKYSSTATINYNKRILGDATGEIGPFGNQVDLDNATRYKTSWYGDYASFANSSYPWFYRGGTWYDGSSSGAFAFGSHTGGVDASLGFRIVLTPTK